MAYRSAFAVGATDLSPYATKADTVSKSAGGTFDNNITVAGTGNKTVSVEGDTSSISRLIYGNGPANLKRISAVVTDAASALTRAEYTLSSYTDAGVATGVGLRYVHSQGMSIGDATGGVPTDPGHLNAISLQEQGVALSAKYALQTNVVPKTGGAFTGSVGLSTAGLASMYCTSTGSTGIVLVTGANSGDLIVRHSAATANKQRFALRSISDEAIFLAQNDAGITVRNLWKCSHDGGMAIGAVTYQGTDSLNASMLYENNVRVQTLSDERYKLDILPLKQGLDDIKKLRNVTSEWGWRKPDKHYGEPGEGFSAQALEAAGFGHLVITDNLGTEGESKRIDKAAMPIIARLVNAVCELSDEITTLKARLA